MSGAGTVSPSAVHSETILRLQQAFKLALSVALLYWLALSMNWDMPKYGALAIALISLDTTGASLRKGVMRMIGTTAGLAVGLLGLSLFAQHMWLMLLFQIAYLVVVGYGLQASRYPYAWFVAGFLPTLVWATTYGKVDNAFHYAIFRYLETSAGIVIYTLVSVLLWPRQAGDQLTAQGAGFCADLRKLFGFYRRQFEDGELAAEAAELRNRLAGTMPKMLATLDAAYTDTSSVAAKKRAWEVFRVNSRAIGDALALWRESIDDCRHLALEGKLPQVDSALETLDRRFARIDDLWRIRSAGEEVRRTDDGDDLLLHPLSLEVDRVRGAGLSHFERAALTSFVQQLTVLDLTSRELLRTMRALAGFASVRAFQPQAVPLDLYRPSRWDPVRLISGLVPAVSFTVAYFFWIYFDPPTGATVPSMAATFGLMVLLTPMNARALIPVLLIAMWCFVAPVYFFVMPRLDSGLELLALIFGYTFAVGSLLGGRLAAVRSMAVILFVMMTGISNQQSYSFMGLVDGAQMLLLAVGIVAVVQTLLSPLRPEQILLSSVRRFFRGCTRVMEGFALDDAADRNQPHRASGRFVREPWASARRLIFTAADRTPGRRLRKRCFESMVLPAPRRMQKAEKSLDYKLYPDNGPEKVERLLDSIQSIAYRLQALEITHARIAGRGSELPESFVPLASQVSESVQLVFERWARLEPVDEIKQQPVWQRLSRDLQQQLDTLETGRDRDRTGDLLLTDVYTMLGSVRGLVEAMANTQTAINQINWQQWAVARF